MTTVLTPSQQEAVEHFEGPLLVLAGPGSGKTRVITHRIARLLQRGAKPDQILALTFTNKAAREMAERVRTLLNGTYVQVSTFHRFCSRLLRQWPQAVGLKENFTILDRSDQVSLIRRLMKDESFDTVHHEPSRILGRISRARNDLISADQFRRNYEERVGDPLDAVVYEIFPLYEHHLVANNAVDFDALLLHVVRMLGDDDDLRKQLDTKFRFVLVDEYQDTNLAQYKIITALSQLFPNLCATGDPDQSIYGWRGARPGNIAHFERDFQDVRIVTLDQNFRSTAAIVQCADQLISHNQRRHPRQLTTDNEQGTGVQLRMFADAEAEANAIAEEISGLVGSGDRRYSDYAVFYRVNSLSRSIETALSRHGVPFQVAAGFSFYERSEVRDLIGYLRVIENHSDETALLRVINRPARGIGEKTILRLRNFAEKHGISLFDAAMRCDEVPSLTGRARRSVVSFVDLIQKLHEKSGDGHIGKLIEQLIAEINYLTLWKNDYDEVDQDRIANIHELVAAARLYEEALRDTEESASLQGFLELASLTSEADNVQESKGAVTLMTMHAAKGLEFPVVYIVGVESGLIPHERAVRNGDPASFEEERRLLFVGMTRAMQQLHLTQTRERVFRGQRRSTIASPFIPEMPLEYVGADDARAPQVWDEHRIDERLQAARSRYQRAMADNSTAVVMSAAELERRRNGQVSESTNVFPIGAAVRHPRYGRGIVIRSSDGSHMATVTVRFETDSREETFTAGKCPLQPIG